VYFSNLFFRSYERDNKKKIFVNISNTFQNYISNNAFLKKIIVVS
jgi:hypothetical protein